MSHHHAVDDGLLLIDAHLHLLHMRVHLRSHIRRRDGTLLRHRAVLSGSEGGCSGPKTRHVLNETLTLRIAYGRSLGVAQKGSLSISHGRSRKERRLHAQAAHGRHQRIAHERVLHVAKELVLTVEHDGGLRLSEALKAGVARGHAGNRRGVLDPVRVKMMSPNHHGTARVGAVVCIIRRRSETPNHLVLLHLAEAILILLQRQC
ncbi:hypothetical protein FVEG_17004 [Fusarium verticillioides 7600]|uniref:Uncharacterized protein n=1 Tax=Gibberella moniliformis (strain M3125 / FGSC 7600) TaxID=334819 RepID=W7MNK3_GIBM7|nr:hypothetical protein FVEG_17004 [Fusarium verticillioides 7600]EWG52651.1 hypothetical protein FVEG_17004 [Fusarium verticillioides 7600]